MEEAGTRSPSVISDTTVEYTQPSAQLPPDTTLPPTAPPLPSESISWGERNPPPATAPPQPVPQQQGPRGRGRGCGQGPHRRSRGQAHPRYNFRNHFNLEGEKPYSVGTQFGVPLKLSFKIAYVHMWVHLSLDISLVPVLPLYFLADYPGLCRGGLGGGGRPSGHRGGRSRGRGRDRGRGDRN